MAMFAANIYYQTIKDVCIAHHTIVIYNKDLILIIDKSNKFSEVRLIHFTTLLDLLKSIFKTAPTAQTIY